MRQIVLAVLFVLGCGGGSDPGPGGGPGPGPGPGGGSGVTFRELCHDIGQTMCDKVAMCSPPGDSGCAAQFEDFCCQAQTDCDQDSGGTRDELDACLDGFERLSCDDLMNGETPAECQ